VFFNKALYGSLNIKCEGNFIGLEYKKIKSVNFFNLCCVFKQSFVRFLVMLCVKVTL
jgi:hypothetical protein